MGIPLNITGSDLHLGALGIGVGVNANTALETALAADGRGFTGTETKMSDFFCGDVTHAPANRGIINYPTTTLTLNWSSGNSAHLQQMYIDPTPQGFTGSEYESGSLFFERLATRTQNWPTFACSVNCSYYSIYSSPDQLFGITLYPDPGWSVVTYIATSYMDFYNVNAEHYNIGASMPVNFTARSDIRLKENIQKLGTSPSGIPIYSFKYKGESTYYKGTMAQDLLNMGRQDAVTLMDDGYYGVYYDKLDISHESFDGL